MSANRIPVKRQTGWVVRDDDGADVPPYCVDCVDINWVASDPDHDYWEDGYGNEIRPTYRPVLCECIED